MPLSKYFGAAYAILIPFIKHNAYGKYFHIGKRDILVTVIYIFKEYL